MPKEIDILQTKKEINKKNLDHREQDRCSRRRLVTNRCCNKWNNKQQEMIAGV